MNKLDEADIEKFTAWAEGNKYLFELLCSCKQNNIITFASCGGHEEKTLLELPYQDIPDPYIAMRINSNSLPFIKEIINELKNMSNIRMSVGYTTSSRDNPFGFYVHAIPANCCEVFYRTNLAINRSKENREKIDDNTDFLTNIKRSISASQLFNRAKKMLNYNPKKLRKDIKKWNGMELNFYTNGYYEYLNNFFKLGCLDLYPDEVSYLQELSSKYGTLQKEYTPQFKTSKPPLIEEAKSENFRASMKSNVEIINTSNEQDQILSEEINLEDR